MKKLFKFSSSENIAPYETIAELLEEHNMSEKDLAIQMDISENTIAQLKQAKISITDNYAKSLERIFNVPQSFWLNLQRNYDDKF